MNKNLLVDAIMGKENPLPDDSSFNACLSEALSNHPFLGMPEKKRQIYEVCDELWSKNGYQKIPTGDMIVACLLEKGYRKGSPNQIYEYRTAWQKERNIKASFNPEAPLVDQDEKFLQHLASSITQKIRQKLEEKFAERLKTLEDDADRLGKALESTLADYDHLQDQYASQAQQLEKAALCASQQKELADDAMKKERDASRRSEVIEQEYKQWKDQSQQLDYTLRKENKNQAEQFSLTLKAITSEHNKAMSETREMMESQRHDFMVKLDSTQEETKRVQHQLSKSQQEVRALSEQNGALQAQLHHLEDVISSNKTLNDMMNTIAETLTELHTSIAKLHDDRRDEKEFFTHVKTDLNKSMGQLSQLIVKKKKETA